MELSNLKPAKGSTKKDKRLGRGQGSTTGGTGGRGHKGAQSRSGYKRKKAHEGGQMPLQRRLPKVGFNNIFRVEYVALNLEKLQQIIEKHGVTDITVEWLRQNGMLAGRKLVKVLATGALKAKVNVSVHAISETAKTKIEELGGSVTIVK